MRIVITGATGFIGRALVLRLIRDGHALTALARSPQRAAAMLGGNTMNVDLKDRVAVDAAIGASDAIINLAGESVADKRWSAERKRALTASRVDTTRELIESAGRAGAKLRAFVSTSAVGIYGDTGERTVDETSASADDFLAQVCVAWEAEARRAAELGARVAIIRVGTVLGKGGGAMAKLIPLFRAGFGGKLGSGRQWMSWIHLQDIVEAFASAVTNDRYSGPINGVAPNPVTNAELTTTLGALLHRPTVMTAPAFALKLALGGAASAILASQRVNSRLTQLGLPFAFPSIDEALAQITRD